MAKKSYTGRNTPVEKEAKIIELVAKGMPRRQIMKATHSSGNTILRVVRDRKEEIGQFKETLRSKFGQLAMKGVDRLNDEMDKGEDGKLNGLLLMTTTGMAVDKFNDLNADTPIIGDLHQHLHQHLHIAPEKLQEAAQKLIEMQKKSPPQTEGA